MSYRDYLPSKTFAKSIGVILLVITCIIGLYYTAKALSSYFAERKVANTEHLAEPVVSDILVQDHDKDGLPDWEEVLWGMDPNKADTDGNGVLDGAEVATKRNALIKAGQGSDAPQLSANETELFLQELLVNSTALSQAGDVSEEGATNLLKPVVDNIVNIQIGKVYSRNDLNIIQTITIQDVYKYTTAVDKVFNQKIIGQENAIAVAMGALKDQDPDELKSLSKFEKQYATAIETLRKTPVPAPLADIHLHLVNDFSFFLGSVVALEQVFNNPLPAFASVTQYQSRLDGYIQHVDDYDSAIRYVLKKYSLIYS